MKLVLRDAYQRLLSESPFQYTFFPARFYLKLVVSINLSVDFFQPRTHDRVKFSGILDVTPMRAVHELVGH